MSGKYRWASAGDVNAFFGLMLDNVAGLLLIVSLLSASFGFPIEFAIRYMIPGTALGVLIGDLAFFFLAFKLSKRTGNAEVTAMPLGLDTPSTFGMVFFVLGPAYAEALGGATDEAARFAAATAAWKIGICSIVISGLLKLGCAFGSNWLRRIVPRAGLLGSLAAIALVLITFFPLLDILKYPLVGLIGLSIILTALIGKVPLPFKIPGAVAGLLVAGSVYLVMRLTNLIEVEGGLAFDPSATLFPTEWTTALGFGWLDSLQQTVKYLPIVIPFALATVIGGIDCTESAAAAGDEYNTNTVIGIEAFATLLAGCFGAVIQTTPYIGHPAYKAMGGRAAYTLATALTIGALGVTGAFGYFYELIPKAAVYPILVFVGLEIAAQSFLATPRRHYPAVAIACIPALANLSLFFVGQLGPIEISNKELATNIETTQVLASGFIVTSVIWSSALAMAIDRRMVAAGWFYVAGAIFTLFGMMHSPLPDKKLQFPFSLPFLPESAVLQSEYLATVMNWTLGYAFVAGLMFAWHFYLKRTDQLIAPDDTEEE